MLIMSNQKCEEANLLNEALGIESSRKFMRTWMRSCCETGGHLRRIISRRNLIILQNG